MWHYTYSNKKHLSTELLLAIELFTDSCSLSSCDVGFSELATRGTVRHQCKQLD